MRLYLLIYGWCFSIFWLITILIPDVRNNPELMGPFFIFLIIGIGCLMGGYSIEDKSKENSVKFYLECRRRGITDSSSDLDFKTMRDSYELAKKYKVPKVYGEYLYKGTYLTGKKNITDEELLQFERDVNAEELAEELERKENLEEFASYQKGEKRKAFIDREIADAYEAVSNVRNLGNMIVRSTHIEKESDGAVLAGVATAIGGIGAGVHSALDTARKNAEIRERNAENRRNSANMMKEMYDVAWEYEKQIDKLRDERSKVDKKYISEIDTHNLMDIINVRTISTSISKTGTVFIEANIEVDDLEGYQVKGKKLVVDGTIYGDVYTNQNKVGSCQLVFPKYGIKPGMDAQIEGICDECAVEGDKIEVRYRGKHLWVMEA